MALDDLPEVIDQSGNLRKLGTLTPPPGMLSVFAPYASAGLPMFSRERIVKFANENDTTGRKKFDATWILDQKSHASCNGYAAAAALSRARVRRRLKRVTLSGAYVYSLINDGVDRGSVLERGMRSIENGVATEETVGWDQIYPNRYDRTKAKAEADRFKAFECYAITGEIELFSALMADFDLVVAVDVNQSFMSLNAEGVAGGGRGAGNHAICLDGYRVLPNGQLAADNPGSWGVTYGDQGRAFLTWDNHFANTVRFHQFYAVRSASDDPLDVNPPTITG